MKYVVQQIRSLKPITISFLIFFILEVIFFTRFKVIVGSGMSMYPTIKDHTILLCKYSNNYKVGDIVYYKVGNNHIVHRIIQITEHKMIDNSIIKVYKIKGDNNEKADMFEVYDENLICKVGD